MAEKKEKRYVSDNAQLMAEWDWEKNDKLNISGCSAVGSAPALGAGCRRFESCHSDQKFQGLYVLGIFTYYLLPLHSSLKKSLEF